MSGIYCNYRLLHKHYTGYASRIVELIPTEPSMLLRDLDFIYYDHKSSITLKNYNESTFFEMIDTLISYEKQIYDTEILPLFGEVCRTIFNEGHDLVKYGIFLMVEGVNKELDDYLDLCRRTSDCLEMDIKEPVDD